MNWRTRSLARRSAFWPEVEAFYGGLPPALFRPGVLLRHDLARLHSRTGQFADLWTRPADPPWLDLHLWLLDDWGLGTETAERHLGLAMAATVAAAAARESRQEPDTGFDDDDAPLEAALFQEAAAQFAQVFPADSPFWGWHSQFISDWERAQAAPNDAALSDADAQRRLADQLAFGKLPAAAAALLAGEPRAAQLPALLDLIDRLCLAHQLLQECLALRRDAQRGRLSYPILRTLRAAGLNPAIAHPPERVLGALLLTGALTRLAEEAAARLAEVGRAARTLESPTLARHCDALAGEFQALRALFTPGAAPTEKSLTFAPADGGREQALMMAAGYLLADRTFQESWEIQRRGALGTPELTGRVFAPGLILEALAPHHPELSAEVDALLDRMAAEGFRYYPHPAVPPDADDLGLALRLLRHAGDPARHRAALQTPLRWMEANRSMEGFIPCWFTRGVEDLDTTIETSLWGDRCATVEANLLLGLMNYDPDRCRAVIERAARGWLERWAATGLGGNALYVSAYALWAAARLLRALGDGWPDLRGLAERAGGVFAERLQLEARRADSAQAAAFLTLTCRETPGLAGLPDPAWIRLILKRQSYDGSWAAEPLYVTPTRGEGVAWYASRTVTTAFCYAALRVAFTDTG